MVRRVSGRSLGTYLREEIAGPLGAEFFVGLPGSEEHRVARLISFLESLESGGPLPGLDAVGVGRRRRPRPRWLYGRQLPGSRRSPDQGLVRPGRGVLGSEHVGRSTSSRRRDPAANGICDARSLARLYGACVGDVAAPRVRGSAS